MNQESALTKQRRQNLRVVLEEQGGPASFAKKLGQAGPSFLSQMANGHRAISEKTSRNIEQAAGKPEYWMDQPHSSVGGVAPQASVHTDPSFVGAAVKTVAEIQQRLGVALSPDKYGEIVNLVYEQAQRAGTIDPDYALRLLKLTI